MGELVNWTERLAQDAKDVATLYTPSVGRIGLKSGQMTYEGNVVPNNTIQVIILASAFENAFYSKAYNPNELSNPDCFALSLTGEGMVPDKIVQPPISPTCDTCTYLKWGSDPKGGRGKACKEGVRLALIPVGNARDAEGISRSEMATLKLPVMSVKNWGNYVQQLNIVGRPAWSVITEVKVVPDPKSQFRVLFNRVGLADEPLLGALNARIAGAQQVIMTPYDSTGAIEEEPKDTGKKKKF